MPGATLHDGSTLEFEVFGEGPALLLPVNPRPVEGERAELLRAYGNDPALGKHLIEGLQERLRVIAFDYEGHVLREPKPDTLTPENIVKDVLAVAQAAGASRFAYYGYSWLGLVGLQLALRTDRLSALVMGGFPPLGGPYREMLRVTLAAHENAGRQANGDEWSTEGISKEQTKQFVTLYTALQSFDDSAIQSRLRCSRLCFAGSRDEIRYGKEWGDVLVSLAGPLLQRRSELEALGWEVRLLDGLDHTAAMQPGNVLPILRSWLLEAHSS
ncbi:alpha/beta fold hydrolase [Archangium lipolyticum]|uniref:alpha/beta fold hydrolase n=1 Tax=Archangium lipolyticum TaxID=2970465 RepID=UPI00214A61D4|nr:hypothetical protein [Archangium lipolyticum]